MAEQPESLDDLDLPEVTRPKDYSRSALQPGDERWYCPTCKDRGRKPWRKWKQFSTPPSRRGVERNLQCRQCVEEDLEALIEDNKFKKTSHALLAELVQTGKLNKRFEPDHRLLKGKASLQVSDNLLACFGGPEKFAEFWYKQIRLAARKKPGSPAVLNAIRDAARLFEATDALRIEVELADLPDDDFAQVVSQRLMNEVFNIPQEVLIDHLKERGVIVDGRVPSLEDMVVDERPPEAQEPKRARAVPMEAEDDL